MKVALDLEKYKTGLKKTFDFTSKKGKQKSLDVNVKDGVAIVDMDKEDFEFLKKPLGFLTEFVERKKGKKEKEPKDDMKKVEKEDFNMKKVVKEVNDTSKKDKTKNSYKSSGANLK